MQSTRILTTVLLLLGTEIFVALSLPTQLKRNSNLGPSKRVPASTASQRAATTSSHAENKELTHGLAKQLINAHKIKNQLRNREERKRGIYKRSSRRVPRSLCK